MRRGGVLLGAIVATFVALLALLGRANYSVAVPLATLAVVLAGGVLLLAIVPAGGTAPAPSSSRDLDPVHTRAWLRSDRLGREEIVRHLDRLDRMGAHPTLALRTAQEMARLQGMSRDRFLQFVVQRMDEIEASS